jgi:hypothetical protein
MNEADENKRMRVFRRSLLLLVLVVPLFSACVIAPQQPEPVEEPAPPPPPPPEEVEEAEEQPGEEFVVSEEVYTKTFDEIEEFIRNLNDIIRREDYDTWLTFLSEQYIERTSAPAYLKEQSQQPLLKKSGITLTSLKDYFEHVVVPSRIQAELDEIEFVGENQVKAYSMIKNTRALLFLLVRENDKWKIGVW